MTTVTKAHAWTGRFGATRTVLTRAAHGGPPKSLPRTRAGGAEGRRLGAVEQGSRRAGGAEQQAAEELVALLLLPGLTGEEPGEKKEVTSGLGWCGLGQERGSGPGQEMGLAQRGRGLSPRRRGRSNSKSAREFKTEEKNSEPLI